MITCTFIKISVAFVPGLLYFYMDNMVLVIKLCMF